MPKRKARREEPEEEEEEEVEEELADKPSKGAKKSAKASHQPDALVDEEHDSDDDDAESGGGGGSSDEEDEGEDEGESSEDDDDSSEDDSAPEVSDHDDDDDDDDDLGGDTGGEAYEQINVDFEFFDPKEIDFLGLKALLTAYLDGQPYDCSGLVDTIIKQAANVGTVVKTANDDDPLAVMTVLSTAQHVKQAFMAEARQFMLTKCSDVAKREKLQKAFDAPGTGLLINERLINSPPQMAPPLVRFLFEEIEGAAEDEESKDRDFYKFKRYVLMTRAYTDPAASGAGANASGTSSGAAAGGSKKQAKAKQGSAAAAAGPSSPGGAPLLVYVRPEDEFLHRQAQLSFTFPVEGRSVGKDELQPVRLVLVVDAAKVPAARKELDKVVGVPS